MRQAVVLFLLLLGLFVSMLVIAALVYALLRWALQPLPYSDPEALSAYIKGRFPW